MAIRFQWPWYRDHCYECGRNWDLRWPVRRVRKHQGPLINRALPGITASSEPIFSRAALFSVTEGKMADPGIAAQVGSEIHYTQLSAFESDFDMAHANASFWGIHNAEVPKE